MHHCVPLLTKLYLEINNNNNDTNDKRKSKKKNNKKSNGIGFHRMWNEIFKMRLTFNNTIKFPRNLCKTLTVIHLKIISDIHFWWHTIDQRYCLARWLSTHHDATHETRSLSERKKIQMEIGKRSVTTYTCSVSHHSRGPAQMRKYELTYVDVRMWAHNKIMFGRLDTRGTPYGTRIAPYNAPPNKRNRE